tara:strand:- start:1489 stop:1731 length:243 start_codon:yes stop_codon:yes gene_type:complete
MDDRTQLKISIAAIAQGPFVQRSNTRDADLTDLQELFPALAQWFEEVQALRELVEELQEQMKTTACHCVAELETTPKGGK